MINEYTRLYPCKAKEIATNKKANHIKLRIYYSKGGFSYWDYKDHQRGYYFSLTPVEENGIMEGFIIGSGKGKCILPCERQSKRRYEEAKAMADDLWSRYGNQILADGYELTTGTYISESERERK